MPPDVLSPGPARQGQQSRLAELYDDPAVRALARVARRHDARLWVVGGPVRDALLGQRASDLDLLTDAPAPAVRALLLEAGGYGQVAGAHGTVRGQVRLPDGTRTSVDVSPLAAPAPHVAAHGCAQWDALAWDLHLRDLTVNAIALDAVRGSLHDPCAGGDALREGVLHTPLPAHVTFSADPVRMVRAARFGATLQMALSDDVVQYIRAHAPALGAELAQRTFGELLKVADQGPDALLRFLRVVDGLGFLDRVVAAPDPSVLADLSATSTPDLLSVLAALSAGIPDGERRERLCERGVPRALAARVLNGARGSSVGA